MLARVIDLSLWFAGGNRGLKFFFADVVTFIMLTDFYGLSEELS